LCRVNVRKAISERYKGTPTGGVKEHLCTTKAQISFGSSGALPALKIHFDKPTSRNVVALLVGSSLFGFTPTGGKKIVAPAVGLG